MGARALGEDRSGIGAGSSLERFLAAKDAAARLRSARRGRDGAIAERRRVTVREVRRARQLRYDRYGTVTAMWLGDDRLAADLPEEPAGAIITEFTADGTHDVVSRLFEISFALAAVQEAVDGPERDRVAGAIEQLDCLIRDVRLAAFDSARALRPGRRR